MDVHAFLLETLRGQQDVPYFLLEVFLKQMCGKQEAISKNSPGSE